MECPYKPGNSAAAAEQQKQTINEDANEPIPQPPTHWFARNLPEINPNFPISSVWRLASVYGDIVKVDLVTRQNIMVSSYELCNEVMDESRFHKSPTGALKELRALLGDGLFSAYGHEAVSMHGNYQLKQFLIKTR
jgi:cytochrome P450/NADPH-cytochrome P450 reductase